MLCSKNDIKSILDEKGLTGDGESLKERIEKVSAADVERVLSQPGGLYSLERLMVLISPAAEKYLEQMARQAHQLTTQRFGRTIKLYAPLYLSNLCVNSCLYCGFNRNNKFERTRLTIEQAVADADIIAGKGFRDILLVSGEDKQYVSIDYLAELSGRLREKFSSISMEVYQMDTEQYARLFEAGIEGVTLYQETYNESAYSYYHPTGSKADYDSRLNAPDMICSAGMREIGLGALFGLSDWRIDTLALAEHAHYLMKQYWQSHVSFSFPRLRPAYEVNQEQFEHIISDKNLVQIITAIRLCFADAGLVISTRERPQMRDNLVKLGITKISAGSKTNPGGYSGHDCTIEQFQISDCRSAGQVASMIEQSGLEPVWKDWDKAFIE